MTIEGLREGLRATGLEEGRNVALILHHALGNVAEAEAAARALERDEKVDVIVAIGTTTALAVNRATTEIPIVFAAGTDPVSAGLVESIAKPVGTEITESTIWTVMLSVLVATVALLLAFGIWLWRRSIANPSLTTHDTCH